MKLKSTKQTVHNRPYIGSNNQPWPSDYRRVLIPNSNGINNVQIVHISKLQDE